MKSKILLFVLCSSFAFATSTRSMTTDLKESLKNETFIVSENVNQSIFVFEKYELKTITELNIPIVFDEYQMNHYVSKSKRILPKFKNVDNYFSFIGRKARDGIVNKKFSI